MPIGANPCQCSPLVVDFCSLLPQGTCVMEEKAPCRESSPGGRAEIEMCEILGGGFCSGCPMELSPPLSSLPGSAPETAPVQAARFPRRTALDKACTAYCRQHASPHIYDQTYPYHMLYIPLVHHDHASPLLSAPGSRGHTRAGNDDQTSFLFSDGPDVNTTQHLEWIPPPPLPPPLHTHTHTHTHTRTHELNHGCLTPTLHLMKCSL